MDRKKPLVWFVLFVLLAAAPQWSAAKRNKSAPVVPAETEQAVAAAETAYQKLMDLNPPQNLEYQSRVMLAQARQLLEKKDYAGARDKAAQAQAQAEMAFTARSQMISETRDSLAKSKAELEGMYLPGYTLIENYWSGLDALEKKSFDQAKTIADLLRANIAKEKQFSIAGRTVFTIDAPEDEVRRLGWPRLYQDVTAECALKEVVDTVEPGKQVNYLRMHLCNRQRTYYMVENPKTGLKGWMAERYVAPDRATRH